MAGQNLLATCTIRIFAAFEAALRSYHVSLKNYDADAATMIDQVSSHRRMAPHIRLGAHQVRRVRNFHAHEADGELEELPMSLARNRLLTFLSRLPEQWDG